jgi:hypothetical protein
MNLQEDINRIKEVMGINENRNLFFIRRQDEFLEDVLNSFDWVEAQESNTFEEYVEDILRHSIDSLFGYNNILVTNEEIDELIPTALHILRSKEKLYNQIKGFWYRQLSSRVDESKEMVPLKRRIHLLDEYIELAYDWLSPRRFDNFEHFLKRVVFSATRDFVHDEMGGEYKNQLDIRDKFEPMVVDYIKRNKELYDKIYNYYMSNI